MQQHTLIDLGEVESVTNLVGAPALDVAQRDDGPLVRAAARRSPGRSRRASRTRSAGPPAAPAAATTSRPGDARDRPRRSGRHRRRPRAPGQGRGATRTGSTRPSRCARVFAVLTRMRKTHVFNDERPSNRSRAPSTRSQVSCTTSSASARVGTKICATCSSDECHSRTIRRNVSSSPARSAATRSASVGSTRRPYRKARQAALKWAVTGSNRRPPGCKPGALPAELTAHANVDREHDYRRRRDGARSCPRR